MANVEMVEVKEPRLVTFADGDVVVGTMLSMEKFLIRDQDDPDNESARKPVMRVIVQDDEGELLAIHCTYDLLQKLRPEFLGHRVDIRYLGEDHGVRRNGNSMRRFKVLASRHPVVARPAPAADASKGRQLEDGTYITNDDIPF